MLTNPNEIDLQSVTEAKKYIKNNLLNIACNMAVIIAEQKKGK